MDMVVDHTQHIPLFWFNNQTLTRSSYLIKMVELLQGHNGHSRNTLAQGDVCTK